jgi:DNA repair protein RadC
MTICTTCGSTALILKDENPDLKYLQNEDSIIASAMDILLARMKTNNGEAMMLPRQLEDYLKLKAHQLDTEQFGVVFLDVQMRAIEYEQMFAGTLSQCSVYPREVVRRALHHNAYAVVIHHNHISGSVEPSPADIALTARLNAALKLVDVMLVDHVITSGNAAKSMALAGLM